MVHGNPVSHLVSQRHIKWMLQQTTTGCYFSKQSARKAQHTVCFIVCHTNTTAEAGVTADDRRHAAHWRWSKPDSRTWVGEEGPAGVCTSKDASGDDLSIFRGRRITRVTHSPVSFRRLPARNSRSRGDAAGEARRLKVAEFTFLPLSLAADPVGRSRRLARSASTWTSHSQSR